MNLTAWLQLGFGLGLNTLSVVIIMTADRWLRWFT